MYRTFFIFALVAYCKAQSTTDEPETPQNITCRIEPRSKCFLGKCPTGFTCLENDNCCDNNEIVNPVAHCEDFLENCEGIKCDHVAFYEFARANCAKTCNYCEDKPLAPEYNCNDLLDDCRDRAELCRDRDFYGMMSLYCPRTCALCNNEVIDRAQCGDALNDCATRGEAFCNSYKTSLFQKTIGCGKTCGMC